MPTSKRRAETTMEEGTARKRQHVVDLPVAVAVDDNAVKAGDDGEVTQSAVSAKVDGTILPKDDSTESLRALTRLHTDFENLRHTLTCKICEKLFYEPFVLSCGHTYCYRCLSTWFASTKKASCPQCRVKVVQMPAPSYVVKELVAIFVARAELLPDGETIEEHETWKKEEADFMISERDNTDARKGGLFRGMFKSQRQIAQALLDPSDNVARCPRCHWEIANGECEHCGMEFDEDGNELTDDASGTDEDSYWDGVDDVDADMVAEDPDRVWYEGEMSPNGYEDSDSDSDDSASLSRVALRHNAHHMRAHQSALRGSGHPWETTIRPRPGTALLARQRMPGGGISAMWGYAAHDEEGEGDDVGYEDEEGDDDDDEEEEDEGSMDGFIVDDDATLGTIGEQTAITIDSAPDSEPIVIEDSPVQSRAPVRRGLMHRRRVVIDDDEDEDDNSESNSSNSGSGSGSGSGTDSDNSSSSSTTDEEEREEGDEDGSEREDEDGSDEEEDDDDDDDNEEEPSQRRRRRRDINSAYNGHGDVLIYQQYNWDTDPEVD